MVWQCFINVVGFSLWQSCERFRKILLLQYFRTRPLVKALTTYNLQALKEPFLLWKKGICLSWWPGCFVWRLRWKLICLNQSIIAWTYYTCYALWYGITIHCSIYTTVLQMNLVLLSFFSLSFCVNLIRKMTNNLVRSKLKIIINQTQL